ncbi:hypothetical protein PoB_004533800 [Plakobranchus ocellatus]|uniref:Uncharacterized protein n=1 Tax=Plakobranchus ocellatus TaxID=259542 RepID=A0AAV4BGW0_9GAST|nr:hypothetical protein PoB_004533800 [Plakobranchus ocellatus]
MDLKLWGRNTRGLPSWNTSLQFGTHSPTLFHPLLHHELYHLNELLTVRANIFRGSKLDGPWSTSAFPAWRSVSAPQMFPETKQSLKRRGLTPSPGGLQLKCDACLLTPQMISAGYPSESYPRGNRMLSLWFIKRLKIPLKFRVEDPMQLWN